MNDRAPRPRPSSASLAALIAWLAVLIPIALVMGPWFRDLGTFGFHDWDVQTAHRFLVRLSLLRYHEFPSWNPFACGGFPAWGYVEADTVVVSPFLPAYLLLPMSVALRVEVLGMALVGAAGAYAAASRFTESRAARALVAVLWAVNGRWALQTASGHTWHLAYAWLPWCLYFFERARRSRAAELENPTESRSRVIEITALGAAIAMLVYGGGIYPLPHTVLALGVYALVVSLLERSARPLVTLAAGGITGIGLSAPKLLPLLDGFKKAPRLIESNETIDLGAFLTTLISRDQAFNSRPARVTPYGWHEWGIYISLAGVLLLMAGFVFVQGRRETALKATGLLFVILGFGAFHADAPWTLFHAHLPVFKSQHVPSRFTYPAILLLGIVVAVGLGRLIAGRPGRELLAGLLVLALGVDIGLVAQKPMAQAMWMVPPAKIPQGPFHFEKDPPFQYKKRDWAGPMYLAMLGNTGVINCYGTPPFDRKGALAVTDPKYRGEAFVEGAVEGGGGREAKVVTWSPNRAVIEVQNAGPEALVVYNMNYDEGWRADVGPVIPFENAVAVRLPAGVNRVTFSYRPPYFGLGLLLGLGTVAALVALRRRELREAA